MLYQEELSIGVYCKPNLFLQEKKPREIIKCNL